MRPIMIILGAVGLAGLAVNSFMHEHWTAGTAFLAGSLALILPALFGQGFGNWGDADLLIRLVRNPFGTVVDEAVHHLDQSREQAPAKAAEAGKPAEAFDPDAAIARYLAQRDTSQAVQPDPALAPAAPVRTFGRKQV